MKILNLGRQKYPLSSDILGGLLENSQTDKGTMACLKILDQGGKKIQSRIAWILVGNVKNPKRGNIAIERICHIKARPPNSRFE